MHREILTGNQIKLLPIVQMFSRNFGLVGGTAIALQIGHRHSIDFDLFAGKKFSNFNIRKRISGRRGIRSIFKDEEGQYTFVIYDVQFTFFHYPYKIDFSEKFEDIIKIPNLLTLAAMKAFALGRRSKWKDYVDLYFIIKNYHPIKSIIKRGQKMFGHEFNEKLFRSQLAYFKDINYSEEVEFLPGFAVSDKEIKKELIKFSLS
ncbi:nucleotidyl transferase AbiEii/AbiGii toxin family protein [Patescibacteria group bacterium]|nr:nucleotidyl transferase AbiEii/AbiGii toxin family protein [Patescibacteria group bacterium]